MSWSHPDVVQVFPSRFWFRRERHTRSLSSLNSCLFFLISNYFRLIKFQMRLDFAGYDIQKHGSNSPLSLNKSTEIREANGRNWHTTASSFQCLQNGGRLTGDVTWKLSTYNHIHLTCSTYISTNRFPCTKIFYVVLQVRKFGAIQRSSEPFVQSNVHLMV